MTAMNIPSAKDIDYTKVDEICGYQMFRCKIFENHPQADAYSVMSTLLCCNLFDFGVSKDERIKWIETLAKRQVA